VQVSTNGVRDYLDWYRRRKLWIILRNLGISSAFSVVALRLSVYAAEETFLVDPQRCQTVSFNKVERSVGPFSTIRQEVCRLRS